MLYQAYHDINLHLSQTHDAPGRVEPSDTPMAAPFALHPSLKRKRDETSLVEKSPELKLDPNDDTSTAEWKVKWSRMSDAEKTEYMSDLANLVSPPTPSPIRSPSYSPTSIRSLSYSPTPTEPCTVILTPEEHIEQCKSLGIKVRDFAYEQSTLPVPEMFNPIAMLVQHDACLYEPSLSPRWWPSSKNLVRLLELGWVSEEEAQEYWFEEDIEHLMEYRDGDRKMHPYFSSTKRARPTRAKRISMRNQAVQAHFPDTRVTDEPLNIPEDIPGLWDGDKPSRQLIDSDRECGAPEPENEPRPIKRRKVDADTAPHLPVSPTKSPRASRPRTPFLSRIRRHIYRAFSYGTAESSL